MTRIRIHPYSEFTDNALATTYFNTIQYMNMAVDETKEEIDDFFEEVDKRKGLMTRLEWLRYNY